MAKKSGQGRVPPTSDEQPDRDLPRPYIIQIDRPGLRPQIEEVRDLLAGTGVQIDEGYGPIPVNPGIGRYVVRGTATLAARRLAEKIQGVQFFGDAKIGPLGQPQN